MSSRPRLTLAKIVKPFGRKLSGPADRGWGDTIVGPLDLMAECDDHADPGQPPDRDADEAGEPGERSRGR